MAQLLVFLENNADKDDGNDDDNNDMTIYVKIIINPYKQEEE